MKNLSDEYSLLAIQGPKAVEAMQYLDNVLLLIVGGGDVLPVLKEMVNNLSLNDKVQFVPRRPPEKLAGYTASADIGLD